MDPGDLAIWLGGEQGTQSDGEEREYTPSDSSREPSDDPERAIAESLAEENDYAHVTNLHTVARGVAECDERMVHALAAAALNSAAEQIVEDPVPQASSSSDRLRE